MKAKITSEDVVLKFPYTLTDLASENPYTQFGTNDLDKAFRLTDQALFGNKLVDYVEAPRPAFNPVTEYLVRATPTKINGVWTQGWTIAAHDSSTAAQNLVDLRVKLEEDIKAIRDQRKIDGGFAVVIGGVKKWFHSDTFSRTQWAMLARKADKVELQGGDMDAVMQKLDGSGDLIWKLMGGTGMLAITPRIVQSLATAGEIQDTQTFYRAEVLIATIKAHPAPFLVNLHTGWPQIFGEPDPT